LICPFFAKIRLQTKEYKFCRNVKVALATDERFVTEKFFCQKFVMHLTGDKLAFTFARN